MYSLFYLDYKPMLKLRRQNLQNNISNSMAFKQPIQAAESFIRERVVIFGYPGSGKSSVLRRLLMLDPESNENLSLPNRRIVSNGQFERVNTRDELAAEDRSRFYSTWYQDSSRNRGTIPQSQLRGPISPVRPFSYEYYYIVQSLNTNICMDVWNVGTPAHLPMFLDPRDGRSQCLIFVYEAFNVDQLEQVRGPLQDYLDLLTREERERTTLFILANKIDSEIPVQRFSFNCFVWLLKNDINYHFVSATINKGFDVARSALLECIHRKHKPESAIHRELLMARLLGENLQFDFGGVQTPIYCMAGFFGQSVTPVNEISAKTIAECMDHIIRDRKIAEASVIQAKSIENGNRKPSIEQIIQL